ncbi:carbonic anhydrase 1-like [Ochlerotatus camptorhynchus]|uniref:carbonic anhydrase 1-like n=1 Tax=Ochlerotatus camptorhynchus TaxID=644619 RepID=UPI0031E397E8
MSQKQASNESSLSSNKSSETETESNASDDTSNIVLAVASRESSLPAPIDININFAEKITLPELLWHNYEKLPNKIKLSNTGETVILSAKWPGKEPPYLEGGPLEGKYMFSQLHFHWGNTAVEGSEHTIDGVHLPLEMHIVHFNNAFKSQEEALQHVGGVVSLVYFFNLKSSPNEFIKPVIGNLKKIVFPDSAFKPNPFPIVNLFHTFTNDYFLYWGSTRSASRSHPILWLISRTQECIDFQQLIQFRQLLDQRMRVIQHEPTPVAALGERHLYHVNPLAECCNSTLSVLPHSRYRKDCWLVDRVNIDIGSPGGCKQLIEALRKEMKSKVER